VASQNGTDRSARPAKTATQKVTLPTEKKSNLPAGSEKKSSPRKTEKPA